MGHHHVAALHPPPLHPHALKKQPVSIKTLSVLSEPFSVCKVASYEGVDLSTPFVFTGSTDREKSLVCPTCRVPEATLAREDGWRAFRIEGSLDFSLVGILARISSVLAAEGIGIFAISTFDTDYILVKADNLERALAVLAGAGWAVNLFA